ncbi:YqhA family protein [Methanosarcina hadiensis]|uniref:YqhA family protein n=1 Tax=Methanosarcina hadiensis TaxID=3078083 RepID=UPI0039772A19
MIRVVKFIAGLRFFVLIPVIGLSIAAVILFIKGGIDLIHFLPELVFGVDEAAAKGDIIVEIVEIVHLFLVGTVLFITSLGLYELFIEPLPLSPWLRTHNIEELELNLVGLTAVVIAVNFLSVIFEEQEKNLAFYGIGYALPIAALAYFMKVRSDIPKRSSEEQECLNTLDQVHPAGNNESSWLSNEKKD